VAPPSPTLSASPLAILRELGEERTAEAGEVLYRVGDRDYPFIAIIEGEVAILLAPVTRSSVTGSRDFSES
jgi:hypothetical protein